MRLHQKQLGILLHASRPSCTSYTKPVKALLLSWDIFMSCQKHSPPRHSSCGRNTMFYLLDKLSSQSLVRLCYLHAWKHRTRSSILAAWWSIRSFEPLPNLIGELLADCSFVTFMDKTWLWGVASNPTNYTCKGWWHMPPTSFQWVGPTPSYQMFLALYLAIEILPKLLEVLPTEYDKSE